MLRERKGRRETETHGQPRGSVAARGERAAKGGGDSAV